LAVGAGPPSLGYNHFNRSFRLGRGLCLESPPVARRLFLYLYGFPFANNSCGATPYTRASAFIDDCLPPVRPCSRR
jgi:hypothetical protein